MKKYLKDDTVPREDLLKLVKKYTKTSFRIKCTGLTDRRQVMVVAPFSKRMSKLLNSNLGEARARFCIGLVSDFDPFAATAISTEQNKRGFSIQIFRKVELSPRILIEFIKFKKLYQSKKQ